jgi:hypothetical protein
VSLLQGSPVQPSRCGWESTARAGIGRQTWARAVCFRDVLGRSTWAWLTLSSLGACSFDAAGAGGDGASVDTEATTGGATAQDDHDTAREEDTEDPSGGTVGATSTTGEDATGPTAETSTTEVDGDSSTGEDGCALDNGGCDSHATCTDLGGQIACECMPGWMGDGFACESDAELDVLRLESPCTGTTLACNTTTCTSEPGNPEITVFQGTPGVTYTATLRVRGVVEEKSYSGGTQTGHWYEGGSPGVGLWNVYALQIDGDVYYLNAGTGGQLRCFDLDYEATVLVEGGTTLVLSRDDPDDCQVRNRDFLGQPIVIPDIPPAPDAFDGQFIQIDLVHAEPIP